MMSPSPRQLLLIPTDTSARPDKHPLRLPNKGRTRCCKSSIRLTNVSQVFSIMSNPYIAPAPRDVSLLHCIVRKLIFAPKTHAPCARRVL